MKSVLIATAKYERISRPLQSVHTGHYRVCRFKGFTTPEENGRWTFRVTLNSVSGILNKISQGGETGRRTGLKTLHHFLFLILKTERDMHETLAYRGFQRNRVPAHYNPLQIVFGESWKKK